MTRQGFALVELLVALAICSVIAAGIAGVVPPARAAFEQAPAALDLQQRGRTSLDVIAQAVRSAGVPGFVPAVVPGDPDAAGERFASLLVLGRRANGAQGVLAHDQQGESGALVLNPSACPDAPTVCGFTRGTPAIIADGLGRFDVFVVDDVLDGAHAVVSAAPFTDAYPAGAIVVEADAYTFRLSVQADGTQTLVRETVGGAVQPIVDRIRDLSFEVVGQRLDALVALDPALPAAGGLRLRAAIFMRNAP